MLERPRNLNNWQDPGSWDDARAIGGGGTRPADLWSVIGEHRQTDPDVRGLMQVGSKIPEDVGSARPGSSVSAPILELE